MRYIQSIFLFLVVLLMFGRAQAQVEHERIKRITVFPLKFDKEYRKIADALWWDMREKLTENKRFLVASKNFMEAKDVFQPRGELKPADAIILGRLLDANALVSTFLVDHKLSMRVYETKNGMILWQSDVSLHPALQISAQLEVSAKNLIQSFVSEFPYQGHVIVDNLIGRPVYTEGSQSFFKADIGSGTQIAVGDTAQLIGLKVENLRPIFQNGAAVEVYVEGQVVKVDRHIITVQIVRQQPDVAIVSDALVRVPDELKRTKELYGIREQPDQNLGVQSLVSEAGELTLAQKEKKPLVASLSWIGNLALVLLLAF